MTAMKQILLMIAVVAVVGCGKKTAEEVFAEQKAKAEAGDASAQSIVGQMYRQGLGVEQDFKEGFKWHQKAAGQGLVSDQYNLGYMYDTGQGVEQDFKEAVKWYQKAADQGAAMAQNNLGVMYANGRGVELNYVTAYAWWNIAVTNGNQKVEKGLSQISEIMTPAQIAEAEALVKEMIKKNPKLLNKK